jgi:hypothetical protein
MGALALGLALAFGLGGRGVAERMLEDAYRSGRESRDQVRRDIETARARAQGSDPSDKPPTATAPAATVSGGAHAATQTSQFDLTTSTDTERRS